ncbi:MAG: bifunctional N(6)-L-threonylcarbamoyladenine synthase/serine/threonine protein kinase [Candidatus Lokiarchaeota archaeon]|nr:bifunctional N(6)-L-threonylcarbamoyladenine synthase/serine/threonine protein kinase [Candidatus Lokiarchaeota archaeon]
MTTCLGLESTAHTLSAGVVDDAGSILGVASDTYVPDEGGLHPLKTSIHHVDCFQSVVERALGQAGTALAGIDVVAFSQGPGLGPCLRVGASVARALATFLGVPIVGVNHCVAHVEIGRLACKVDDPLTLYVSGGNTIVSAFDCGRYQVFGETLDIALGNMLDAFAREAGLRHPGGPKVEALARQSVTYVDLPYTVKGMDLALSGLLTSAVNALPGHPIADVAFSLQETSFSMVAEVTERALAHTEKREVLLTGGVAANGRLQEMIRLVSEGHGATFHAVPRALAGDNGAMIAWTGMLQFKQSGGIPVEDTGIIPRWRLDQVPITWRS